jgi:hypothetical protein
VIRNRCYDRRENLLKAAIWFMSFLAVSRLAYQLWRLLFDQGPNGAIDLRFLYKWVNLWFTGAPLDHVIFPPASYAMLLPLTGWLTFEASRWLWAVLYIVSVSWLAHLIIRESGVRQKREIAFAVLFILAIYPTGITIGNGQLILFLLPCILTAVLMVNKRKNGIVRDLAVSLLFLFCSLKITVTVPFLLIPLVRGRGFRPMLIAGCGYILLTYIAISYSNAGLGELLQRWLHDSTTLASIGGYADIHIWLGSLGLKQFILPASLVLISAFSIWLYAFRKIDIWVQLGVAAIVARLWAYHRLYDDLLIIVPAVTIFRLARSNQLSRNEGLTADFLLLITWLGLLSPGFFLQLPPPLGILFRTGEAVIWLSMLVFLLYYSYKKVLAKPALAG